ncbi:Putative E3 ubiquitin-protein ligase LIN [Seminavis robusta]|uniref:E3 ubiquitin-protein ligase LIN n=1 Tax=Seminavis robusta TaxID=568900 RepID=A0A9N8HM88_9STRA|nr:Putative E3 ubiquitin-protein ligase LIN [Seminavis robusta]|eukprot:Sro877_g214590.1 Putative E3 ubiquitin-protein ligase LIN (139) ;mRNA; f:2658-3074
MSDMEINAPEHFVCPISMVVMSHPVKTENGHVFERSAIMEWIYFGKATCPLSREPLHPSKIVPDAELEEEIKQWRLENNIPAPTETSDDDDKPIIIKPRKMVVERANSDPNMSHIMSLREKILKNRDQRVASLRQLNA